MTTVTRRPRQSQTRGRGSTETPLIAGLVLVTSLAIGALLWIVLASGEDISNVAGAAITAIGSVALGAIGAFSVVLRRRSGRNSRS
ncbi:hypothetical protein AB0C02_15540 [Micromonospora sp. NPDC048999]|uniref:hypothetical protein n=1 Tax=Micromonospora sp. NPDC048999 TaxID=3155391 RepID=UPI00340755D7